MQVVGASHAQRRFQSYLSQAGLVGASPHANGGRLLIDLRLPDFVPYAVEVASPGTVRVEATRTSGKYLRDVFDRNERDRNFRLFCPDGASSNRLDAVFGTTDRWRPL